MSSSGFASQNGAGGSYANGPSQNPMIYPSNQSYIAPPQSGYLNSLPAKAPTLPQSSHFQPPPLNMPHHPMSLPASPNHRPVPAALSQNSPTPPPSQSFYQQPPPLSQPTGWYGAEAPPVVNHMSPVPQPPVAYHTGKNTPPVFQNTMQPTGPPPPGSSLNSNAMPAPPPNVLGLPPHQPYATPPSFAPPPPPPPAFRGTSPASGPPAPAVPPPSLIAHNSGSYSSAPGQIMCSSYPSVQPDPSLPLMQPPGTAYQQASVGTAQMSSSLAALSLQSQTPEALRVVNLLQERNLLPPADVPAPTPCLPQDLQKLNSSPEVFRCTLTSIPQTQSLLNKAKLPLGLLLHPFKDLSQLPVVTSSNIVRCRSCRTYINPFVTFVDGRRWKCNLCFRVNDVPEEFMYNPVSRSYGAPYKRPEVQNATIEFIAPSEYMLRPPQPAVYLFVLDVSHNAIESGYLEVVCRSVLDNLDSLPGDARTKIGLVTFDSTIHFYNLQEGLSQPQMLIVSDLDDIFLPTPDSLLVNLNECKELIQDLLTSLPQMFSNTMETQSALGPALQAGFKLLSPTGGRISVFQTQLPTMGAGALKPREDPGQKASAKDVHHLSPATDFYKKLALDCSAQQVAVDLFLLGAQYCDLSSLGCISRYSAGSVYYYPSFHKHHNPSQMERFQQDLKRYLTRKIGFEAVMRIRCSKGLSIHTFHGNFFVRSTDLLSLANVNPDAGFTVQMSIEENLVDMQVVSFQAALLYTSSKGERRIRVHTLCLPVVNSLSDIFAGADVQAITALLASMAVDRTVMASLSDARDALINAAIDMLTSYRTAVLTIQQPGLLAPACLRLLPLYVLALLKNKAFRTSSSTRLDERVFAMCQLKYQPLAYLMPMVHPCLYRVDNLTDEGALNINDTIIPQPRLLQLSVEKLNRDAALLMDCGTVIYLWVGRNCGPDFLTQVLGVQSYADVPLTMNQLPKLDSVESVRTRAFINWLREKRPFHTILHVVRDESPQKADFLQNMIEDLSESALSYYEFLLHLQQQVTK